MHQAITAEKSPPLVSSLRSLFPTLRSQCSQNIYSFQLSWDSSTYYRGVQPSGQFCKKSFYLFPHSKAFLRGLRQNVHKIFTISGFCEIPPLTTEVFNPPDSFAKSPSTCFLTQKRFFRVCNKTFKKYLHIPDLCALSQKAFNSPSKGSALKPLLPVSSLKGRFSPSRRKKFTKYLHFYPPQQRNVALLPFVKGKKTRNWIGAF